MSRRRRREREPGPVRKTVEVLVSGLFGMAVVGVVLVLLQNGADSSPAPLPTATVSGEAFPTGGDGGLTGVRSARAGTVEATPSVNSPDTGSAAGTEPPGARGAQESGRTEPADPTGAPSTPSQPTATAGTGSTAVSSATAAPSASASASPTGGTLGGVVGGLLGGVIGLL